MSPRRVPAPTDDADVRELLALLGQRLSALEAANRELRALVVRGHGEILRRLEERAPTAATIELPTLDDDAELSVPGAAIPPGAAPVPGATRRLAPGEYSRLVIRLRALVRSVVPAGSVVLVVSRGDDDLVDLDGRDGRHFPSTSDGRWAGHHPRDGQQAVAALDVARAAGARWLVLPGTALWWLDHYVELRRHLDRHARLVLRRDDTGVIYELPAPAPIRVPHETRSAS